jgi:hypothetical protein
MYAKIKEQSVDMFQKETPITSMSQHGSMLAPSYEVEPAYYYRYAQSLRSISENDKANQIMEKFDQISGNDSRGELCQNENYMDAIKANSGDIK